MNFPYFIARRIVSNDKSSFSSVISKLAIFSISIGVCAMVLSFFILGGFQETIKNKIYNFKGHLEVTKFTFGDTYDEIPINALTALPSDSTFKFIDHVQSFAHKAGMIKAADEIEGVMFKGVGSDFDSTRFAPNMNEGRFINFDSLSYSTEVVISATISQRLKLKLEDDLIIYFVQDPPRYRKLNIVGIYKTDMEEIDSQLIIGDLKLVQRLNNWPDSLVGGLEVFVKEGTDIERAHEILYNGVEADLYVDTVREKYLSIFEWLDLLRQNANFLVIIILIVACFNMISILLILIMERTNMVGILQALGAPQGQIKKIFIYNGIGLIIKGLALGNLLAFVFAYFQDKFKIITLDASNYYMDHVPIQWNIYAWIMVNLLTFCVVLLALGIPITVITRIKPISALKFD